VEAFNARRTAGHSEIPVRKVRITVSATLRVTRETSGVELRRGQFEVAADGRTVGSVKAGETVETTLEPGRHTLRIRKGRYSTRDCSFDAADSEIVSFRCHGAILWPRYVASLIKPDLGIWLKRE
jgi:hypothetical protein